LITIVGLAACGGGMPGSVVVRVGQTAITETTVDHWMSEMAGGRVVPDPSSRQDQPLRQRALSFLISSQWLLGEAAEEGLKVSKQEIEQRFKDKESASFPGGEAEFHEFLKATGKEVSDVMFEIQAELASSRIRQTVASREPKITQAQIAKYYSQHKQRYVLPERRELEITNRKSKTEVDKLKREVESGRSLASVTQLESIERPATASGTDKGNALERAVYTAKPNVLAGPVKLRVDYYLFEVKRITAGSEQPLARVHSSIEKQLAAEQQRQTLAEFVKAWRKRWIARTSCRVGYVMPDCKRYKGPTAPETRI
jgi:parvulin-like peptidyl-prolyl isomerase